MADKPKDIEAIYNAALNQSSGAERTAYLDAACGDDNVLRSRVEALIKAHEQAGSFLGIPSIDANVTIDGPRMEGPGTKIGRYELLSLIGEGGMGLVYLAQQKEPVNRRVALKIIKPGMDSRQVIARFEAERQALAMLDHPNIAHVFDAGTTKAGLPYFVMEYVKGMSITAYCDEYKLNIEQRLKLFEHVCEGIHHAHQKGIIHRDIKPSNILVSMHGDRAVPKIIDFGIAKATARSLTDKTVFTCQGQLLGTPEYMSPEQVDLATQDIDTRSDIYSLGVLLYELLAGVLPFEEKSLRSGGFAEIQRTIREQEPATPSIRLTNLGEQAKTIATSRGTQAIALARRLHRELEWIPLKAMRKDRCRRYKSASEMADDIQNYLNGSPLIAGPETTMYRMQKFVHKHAGSVATVALVAVAIILGLVISSAMYMRSEEALQREAVARVQAEQAEALAQERKQQAEQQTQLANTAAEALRRELYAAKMNLTHQAWDHSNLGRMRQLLKETEAYPGRGFEWYYWQRQTHLELRTLRGHFAGIAAIAYSPDGQRIITGSADGTAKVWDAASGNEVLTLRGHDHEVGGVAFTPNGQRIVTGSDDSTAKVWDAISGKELLTLKGNTGDVRAVAFSPDGHRIVTGSWDTTAKVWEVTSGKELLTLKGHDGGIAGVAFSPDGLRVVTGSSDRTAKVWDTTSGRELLTLQGHRSWIESVAYSPDGQRIVTASHDATAKVWDGQSGKELLTLSGHNSSVADAVYSPDGRLIVTGSYDATVRVWEAISGKEVFTLRGHNNAIIGVAFSPDGQYIVTAGWDSTAKIWEANGHRGVVTIQGHDDKIKSVAFSPNGNTIVTGSWDHTAKVWEATSGKELLTLKGHDYYVTAVTFSPDGQRIITGSFDKTAKVWEATSGRELLTLKGHNAPITAVDCSPDGQRVVTCSWDHTAKVWEIGSGKELLSFKGHNGWISGAAFSPDGQHIVTGSLDGTVKVWDVTSGKEVLTLSHNGSVATVAFSPDGQSLVTGNLNGTAKVWDVTSGKEVLTLSHNGMVATVAFSPDGQRIVTGGDDGTKVWEILSGNEVLTLRRQKGGVKAVAFSPDGQRIVTGGDDSIVKVWEVATPLQVKGWEQEDKAAEERLAILQLERDAASE